MLLLVLRIFIVSFRRKSYASLLADDLICNSFSILAMAMGSWISSDHIHMAGTHHANEKTKLDWNLHRHVCPNCENISKGCSISCICSYWIWNQLSHAARKHG